MFVAQVDIYVTRRGGGVKSFKKIFVMFFNCRWLYIVYPLKLVKDLLYIPRHSIVAHCALCMKRKEKKRKTVYQILSLKKKHINCFCSRSCNVLAQSGVQYIVRKRGSSFGPQSFCIRHR